jgi:N-hydroxyarylamine O-acetyltransferase
MTDPARLDLPAYMARVEYAGPLAPTAEVLAALHLAHATHIPFENLDVLLGSPIRLDLGNLQAKLVHDLRGGYCYEQNLLFAAVLRELGFGVTPLAARVRYRATRLLPRTHMLLKVRADDTEWIADVGFGGGGPLKPVPLAPNRESHQFAWTYRLIDEGGLWVLQLGRNDDVWDDLYSFTLEPQELVDYELANYFVSTHPDSPFTSMVTAQRASPEARIILRNRVLTTDRGNELATRVLADDAELVRVLADTFGLHVPAGRPLQYRDPLS